uniref:Uncharacterized protein n=1 Tax=Anguilla anguilla TaxID=7936 RepID=A0A0E9RU83_ANGAN
MPVISLPLCFYCYFHKFPNKKCDSLLIFKFLHCMTSSTQK